VSGVTFDRRNQVGNEIRAALQLNVDVRPRVLGADSERYQSIIERDEEQYENGDDDEEADQHKFLGSDSPEIRLDAIMVND
jgi:hypothetical protein